LIEGTIAIW